MFNGKKTYLVALASIFGTVTAALAGQISWPDAAQVITSAVMAATIRHGIDTSKPKQ